MVGKQPQPVAIEDEGAPDRLLSGLQLSDDLLQADPRVLFVQNVTEVLVSKHRNGPTGQFKLVFLGELAKFVDGETRRVVLDDGR